MRYTKKDSEGNWYIESKNGALWSDNKGRTYGPAIDCFAQYEKEIIDTCGCCENFLGGGDWNLCCKNPPKDKVGWCGFLCYEDTEACENFKEKEDAKDANM